MKEISILGIKINSVTKNQAINEVNKFIVSKKPHQIVTVNSEFIMTAQHDEEFKKILNSADLNVPDSAGLLFVSNCFYKKALKERVAGIDLMYSIIEIAAKNKYPVYFLGGTEGIAKKTADRLQNLYPGLIVSGYYSGNPNLNNSKPIKTYLSRFTDIKAGKKDKNLKIVEKVKAAKPTILFVAYGAPKQDKFIARYKKFLNIPVMIGVGGSFDFISGKSKRAPRWLQAIWLEWFWRLLVEPWRIKRIFTATVIFPLLVIKNKLFGLDK
jgi:N-acetylglucosaminyldiphosphoundecaprenol N-acetyl-beta-D-mannosaminyltransferase